MMDDELTFAKGLQIAQETEEATKVAKETVYGAKQIHQSPSPYSFPVNHVQSSQQQSSPWCPHASPAAGGKHRRDFPQGTCPRCRKTDHGSQDCPFKEILCNYSQKIFNYSQKIFKQPV